MMAKHGVKPDSQTHALLFEKNVAADDLSQANSNLRSLLASSGDFLSASSLIPNDSLNSFFCRSISQDNFDGLASLVNYVERGQIDISDWEMGRFRSGLDFYLNHAFNISKVLTFSRFYAHHVNSTLRRSVPEGKL